MQQEAKSQSGAQQPPEPSSSAQAEQISGTKTEDEGSEEARGSSMDKKQQVEEDEEEMECGFCLFMKGGGCRESFTAWEKCVEEAEKKKEDVIEKCFEVTGLLKKCMEAHADYYEPILKAEKAMEEEARQELDRERAAASDSQATSQVSEQKVSSSVPAAEREEAKQEPIQERATVNDPQATSEGLEQKSPCGSPDTESKRS